MESNPCLSCGACCARFRVSFYWREADDAEGGTVPVDLTEDVTPVYRCMRGTNQPQPRCAALLGTVGEGVRCTIYEQRSSPCRDFGITVENGMISGTPEQIERCNAARATWNLPPLPAPNQSDSDHPDTFPGLPTASGF